LVAAAAAAASIGGRVVVVDDEGDAVGGGVLTLVAAAVGGREIDRHRQLLVRGVATGEDVVVRRVAAAAAKMPPRCRRRREDAVVRRCSCVVIVLDESDVVGGGVLTRVTRRIPPGPGPDPGTPPVVSSTTCVTLASYRAVTMPPWCSMDLACCPTAAAGALWMTQWNARPAMNGSPFSACIDGIGNDIELDILGGRQDLDAREAVQSIYYNRAPLARLSCLAPPHSAPSLHVCRGTCTLQSSEGDLCGDVEDLARPSQGSIFAGSGGSGGRIRPDPDRI